MPPSVGNFVSAANYFDPRQQSFVTKNTDSMFFG